MEWLVTLDAMAPNYVTVKIPRNERLLVWSTRSLVTWNPDKYCTTVWRHFDYIYVYFQIVNCTLPSPSVCCVKHIDGLIRKRRNSIAYALESRLFCTKPLIVFFCVGCITWHHECHVKYISKQCVLMKEAWTTYGRKFYRFSIHIQMHTFQYRTLPLPLCHT